MSKQKGDAPQSNDIAEWIFFGRVVPERVPVYLGPLDLHYEDKQGHVTDTRVFIHSSQITARVTTTVGEKNQYTQRNIIESIVRSMVDIAGFKRGIAFDVEIVSCVLPDKNIYTFGISIPILYNKNHLADLALTPEALNTLLSNPYVGLVLSDFREAMKSPAQTGFFCYRAADALMQSMKKGDKENDGAAWERMRSALRIDRAVLDFLKSHADWARHGKLGGVLDEERAEMFLLTEELIARFIEYLYDGGKPLGQDKFPTLQRQSVPTA
ncbi:hypothetical protein [Phenylobacterium sp.]|uniref:hypothetical protein n=1 Tax=Phenylobacterium sp. TaxID=1871053 RepID=UPI0035AF2F50